MSARALTSAPDALATDDLEQALAVEHSALKAGIVLAHERLSAALAARSLGWWEWLADLDALTGDEVFESLFGLTAEHGFSPVAALVDRVLADDRPRLAGILADARASDLPVMVLVRVPANGRVRTVLLCGRRYRSSDPGHTCIAGIAIELT